MSDFEKSMERLESIQKEVLHKRKQLMADITEKEPELAEFLQWFKDDKELESKVVWIELDGEVRYKWGKVL